MCGIIGTTKGDKDVVRSALSSFAYRGPDAQKFFSDQAITLGHARLSILDLDERSDQPFFDVKREIGIVFNGEIYNFKELRSELERVHGVQFRTTSDTEVLVYGYRYWGKEMLPKLRGMFAFAIYDMRNSSIFLARDHAGIKPLYYSTAVGTLLFASELKGVVSLLRSSGLPVRVHPSSVHLYQVFGYIPSPLSLVSEVYKLERGTWLTYELKTKCVATGVWKPQETNIDSVVSAEEAARRSVLEHAIADVPVGTFFSGGVDSSLIAALLKESGQPLKAFSVQVEGRTADEPYFRAISKELGLDMTVAEFGLAQFDAMYEDMVHRTDEPIADTSLFPTTYIARVAAREVKVVLSGEGGDELFLGYPRARVLASMKNARHSKILNTLFLNSSSFKGKNTVFEKLAASSGMASAYYLYKTSPARDLAPAIAWKQAEEILETVEPRWFDRDLYLENMLLRKTDVATSYASIEGRVPLLGTELWNAAPHFAQYNARDGKTILKDLLATFVSRELIDRPKAGFGLDIESLFRESKYLRADLDSALHALKGFNLGVSHSDATRIAARYPVYGFGLIMLYHGLTNLDLL